MLRPCPVETSETKGSWSLESEVSQHLVMPRSKARWDDGFNANVLAWQLMISLPFPFVGEFTAFQHCSSDIFEAFCCCKLNLASYASHGTLHVRASRVNLLSHPLPMEVFADDGEPETSRHSLPSLGAKEVRIPSQIHLFGTWK